MFFVFGVVILIHAAQAVEVPSSLSSIDAASLVDAGATNANAVRNVLAHGPEQVLIAGAGPIGLLAAEMRKDASIPLELVEINKCRKDVAAEWGYSVFDSIRDVQPYTAVFSNCTGSRAIPPQAFEILRPTGQFSAAGHTKVPEVNFAPIARKELTVRGVRSGSRKDLLHILELADSHRIRIPSIESRPLEEINEAIRFLREGQVAGKAVVSLSA